VRSGSDPTIEALRARAYTVPTDAPEGDGTLTWNATTMVVVEAQATGRVGTGWTFAPAAAARVVDDLLAPVVVHAHSALAPADAQAAMVRAVRNAGRAGLVGMAISAVDVALWDLGARLLDLPLTRWLGAAPRAVPVYGSGGFTTYDDDRLRIELEGWVTRGLRAVKIKIGESWGSRERRDLARVELARSVVGDDVELFVDANGGYDRGQARRVGRRLDELDVRWFEEPVSSDDLAGLRRVRDAVGADVTAGEYGYDLTYFARMLDAGAVDCLQVDVTRCGGITEWLRVTAVAAAHHIDVSGHCAPHLHVGVAAATPNLRHLEWFHDHVRIERLFFEGAEAEPTDGVLRPCEGPGNGLRVRPRAVEPYRVR
jgi:L-alanine-DL-glutamate epimerase-like enolase superfamily enzyme